MPSQPVAAGFPQFPSDTVVLFKLPKDLKLFKQWSKEVQRTQVYWSLTQLLVLCSNHFPEDFFFFLLRVMKKLLIKMNTESWIIWSQVVIASVKK